jgi:hypothetical protein
MTKKTEHEIIAEAIEAFVFEAKGTLWWHGSPSGDLRGASNGLHLGTKRAAQDAITARIGHPAEGEWDGTREYEKTKLAGQKTLRSRGVYPTGHNADAPEDDYFAHEHPKGLPKFGDGERMSASHKPQVKPYHLIGQMSNTATTPHEDFKANGLMSGQLKKGTAKRGYYYKNKAEDEGSVSIVVPNSGHLKSVE